MDRRRCNLGVLGRRPLLKCQPFTGCLLTNPTGGGQKKLVIHQKDAAARFFHSSGLGRWGGASNRVSTRA